MRHLRSFIYLDAIARAGSIRRAANDLAITSTALNRRVLALEAELGTPLFERVARGVRLSPAGELALRYAREQLSNAERLRAGLSELAGARSGHIALACSHQSLFEQFLPERIAVFREENPNFKFTVLSTEPDKIGAMLADYSADLAIAFEADQSVQIEPVFRLPQQLHAAVGRNHPLAAAPGEEVSLLDCLEYPWAVATRAFGVRRTLDAGASRLGREPNIALEAENYELLQETAARDSQLVSFLIPVGSVGRQELVTRPLGEGVPLGVLQIGHLRDRALPQGVLDFANDLARYLA